MKTETKKFFQPVHSPPKPEEVWFYAKCNRMMPFLGLPPLGTCTCPSPDPCQPNKPKAKPAPKRRK